MHPTLNVCLAATAAAEPILLANLPVHYGVFTNSHRLEFGCCVLLLPGKALLTPSEHTATSALVVCQCLKDKHQQSSAHKSHPKQAKVPGCGCQCDAATDVAASIAFRFVFSSLSANYLHYLILIDESSHRAPTPTLRKDCDQTGEKSYRHHHRQSQFRDTFHYFII